MDVGGPRRRCVGQLGAPRENGAAVTGAHDGALSLSLYTVPRVVEVSSDGQHLFSMRRTADLERGSKLSANMAVQPGCGALREGKQDVPVLAGRGSSRVTDDDTGWECVIHRPCVGQIARPDQNLHRRRSKLMRSQRMNWPGS